MGDFVGEVADSEFADIAEAVSANNLPATRRFLKEGSSPDEQDDDEVPMLRLAARQGSVPMLTLLLDRTPGSSR